MTAIRFEITHRDAGSRARLGRVTTPHGTFDTPVFMPVGTQGTVKGLLPRDVAATGARIILANTYHLLLRPGPDLVARMGGLHHWVRWGLGEGAEGERGGGGAMLTDSGGFQVFSLGDINRINEDGVCFKSHLDGSLIDLTPERSIQVQNALGADIIMAFDQCPPSSPPSPPPLNQDRSGTRSPTGSCFPPPPEIFNGPLDSVQTDAESSVVETSDKPSGILGKTGKYDAKKWGELDIQKAAERTVRWLDRSIQAHQRPGDQGLFGIVQGGTDLSLRSWCAGQVTARDLPGYAIGGVAVGESFDQMKKVVEHTAPLLPENKPRYLMGVGYARDIVMAVRSGVDMFDCVLPTRNGRNANAFTRQGQIRLRNAKFAADPKPIEEDCDCLACSQGFSRSYLRHLFVAQEMLGPILVSIHNLRHFQRLMLDIRRAIADNDWATLGQRWPIVFL